MLKDTVVTDQVRWRSGRAMGGEVSGRRDHHSLDQREFTRAKGGVVQRPYVDANGEVDAVRNEVLARVTHGQLDFQVGMAGQERRQRWDSMHWLTLYSPTFGIAVGVRPSFPLLATVEARAAIVSSIIGPMSCQPRPIKGLTEIGKEALGSGARCRWGAPVLSHIQGGDMKRAGNTIFITGGSSGIGRALAHRWHDLGNTVIVAGRRRGALEETVAGRPGMTFYELDVADPGAIAAVAQGLVAEHPDLNVLVNCAGISGAEDPTTARDLSRGEKMVETNLLGPIRMIDALVDHLKGRPAAAIVTVSSGTGFVPYPAAPTYSASKAALHSYTLSLRALLGDALQVIEIIPPQVATDLMEGLKDSPYSLSLDKFVSDVMAQLISYPSAEEIIVDEVKPFRFAERDGTVSDLVKAMAAATG